MNDSPHHKSIVHPEVMTFATVTNLSSCCFKSFSLPGIDNSYSKIRAKGQGGESAVERGQPTRLGYLTD